MGQQSDSLLVTAELKSLLRRTHDSEKDGLTFRTQEALKIQAEAKEAYIRLQRANSSFFGSIRYFLLLLLGRKSSSKPLFCILAAESVINDQF